MTIYCPGQAPVTLILAISNFSHSINYTFERFKSIISLLNHENPMPTVLGSLHLHTGAWCSVTWYLIMALTYISWSIRLKKSCGRILYNNSGFFSVSLIKLN